MRVRIDETRHDKAPSGIDHFAIFVDQAFEFAVTPRLTARSMPGCGRGGAGTRRRFGLCVHDRLEGGLGSNVVRRQIEYTLVHGSRLVRLLGPQERIAQRQIRIDEPRPIVRAVRVLHALLVVTHRVRLETRESWKPGLCRS